MIEWRKLNTSILTVILVGLFGFFIDFQIVKNELGAVEHEILSIREEMQRIKELKELQCEVAVFLFKESSELDRIIRHCK